MTIWEWLGIHRTTDIKTIKRAYAKQLQIYHPEDDPQGYQSLREAYDAALTYVKRASRPVEDMVEIDVELVEAEVPPPDTFEEFIWPVVSESPDTDEKEPATEPDTTQPDSSIHKYRTVTDIVEAVIAVYDHFPSRISSDCWIEILNSDLMWKIESKHLIGKELWNVLQTRKYLPAEIWRILEITFEWEAQYKETYGRKEPDPNSFLSFFRRQLWESELRYEPLLEAEGLDYEAYLHCRDQACYELSCNLLEPAEQHLKRAYSMFAHDPDLLRLLAEYYLRIKSYETSLGYIEQLIQCVPDETDGYLYKAKVFYHTGQYARTLEECTSILSRWPDHYEAQILSGHCYKAMGRDIEAAAHFNKLSNTYLVKDQNKPHEETAPTHTYTEPVSLFEKIRSLSRKRKIELCLMILFWVHIIATILKLIF